MITTKDIIKSFNKPRPTQISVSYKKTVKTRDYENETIEADMTFELAEGEHPMLEAAKAEAMLEIEVLMTLMAKHQMSQDEFVQRKKELEDACSGIEGNILALKS